MQSEDDEDRFNLEIARRWCAQKGDGWVLTDKAGRGGTAPVFGVEGPSGPLALKIYDAKFSSGEKGRLEEVRVSQQLELGRHGCPFLVEVHDGGRFEDRLFLLMDRAPGRELEKALSEVPRSAIRLILDQVTIACQFLRERGLSHRDLKSANIFISDDFSHATVLDLSVIRDIHDPVGIGTDHGSQLPVVATARYCPPEYLFRLDETNMEFWHGVDVYQLGGLLHDLIMKKPLFEEEYQQGKENRYRFAWIVATKDPVVSAEDVDQDLVILARRALDKNWMRRRKLELGDFRDHARVRQIHSASVFGIGGAPSGPRKINTAELSVLRDLIRDVETGLLEKFRALSITPLHEVRALDAGRKQRLRLIWSVDASAEGIQVTKGQLDIYIWIESNLSELSIQSKLHLTGDINKIEHSASMELPAVRKDVAAVQTLVDNITGSLGALSVKALSL